jgi:signal transduction histidine kinase
MNINLSSNPASIDRATPFVVILFLLMLALLYLLTAYMEYRNSIKDKELISRTSGLANGAQNFIILTSHYLNSPISKMQLAAEYLLDKNKLTKSKSIAILEALASLKNTADKLLKNSSGSSNEVIKDIASENLNRKTNKSLVWVPLLVCTLIIITANYLFFGSIDAGSRVFNYANQVLLFAMSSLLLFMGWRSLARSRLIKSNIQKTLKKEELLMHVKIDFIKNAAKSMQRDLKALQRACTGLEDTKEAQELFDGLSSLQNTQKSFAIIGGFENYKASSRLGTKDFKKSIDDAIKNNKKEIEDKKLTVHTHLKGGISAYIDAPALDMIIGSVINNAVKFNKQNGEINIYVEHSKNRTIFEVEDTGVGIGKKQIHNLQTPFSRIDNAMKFNHEGLGIGLYTDKIILDRVGGIMQVKSKPNYGTKLIIGLPNGK